MRSFRRIAFIRYSCQMRSISICMYVDAGEIDNMSFTCRFPSVHQHLSLDKRVAVAGIKIAHGNALLFARSSSAGLHPNVQW